MFLILLSHLPRHLLAREDQSPSPLPSPPPFLPRSPSFSTSFRPSIAVIVGVLTTMFSLTFLLLLYAKHCKRHATTYNPASTNNTPSAALDRRHSGVDRSVVDSLPLFRFGSLTGQKEGLECAVCLNRFDTAEVLRLLPKCKHAFHVECVGMWLESHSTCPLCRVRVAPEDVLLVLDPDPPPPPPPPPPPQVSLPRRISGRHSSAGESCSGGGLKAPASRRSEGGEGTTAAGRRKDGMLPTATAAAAEDEEEFERRFSHQIIVSGSGERWSDLKPSDLLYLRSEMIITESGRISASASARPVSGGGKGVNSLRSVSEITGMSRFREGEERTLNKWLGFKAKRPVNALSPGLFK